MNLLFSFLLVAAANVAEPVPVSRQSPYWAGAGYWDRRHEAKMREIASGPKAYDFVFIGDSITHNWEGWSDPADVAVVDLAYREGRLKFPNGPGRRVWEEMKREFRLLNLGVGGDRTQNVLWRIEHGELDGYTTHGVALMIGTNNGEPPAEIAAGVKAVLERIAEKQPKAKVVLMPIFPCQKNPTDEGRLWRNETNGLLRQLADGDRVVWLDFNSAFLEPDGRLLAKTMPDYLHPLEDGYRAWRAAIEPVMRRIVRGGRTAPVTWDESLFSEVPRVWDFGSGETNGIRTIFYENVDYRGKPTRCFAYLGLPKARSGGKVPAMVLVHGGGGSAFYRWVKYWNDRGYAAISMDHEGCVSGNAFGQEQYGHVRHEWSGPSQGAHDWLRIDEPVGDQWTYHAVASVIRANTLLRSLPEVDADRIGLTGVSWGGFLACIAAGVDPRFRFAAPVYGCGFITEHSMWMDDGCKDGFKCVPRPALDRYAALWDPKNYLPLARMPFLFVDGTADRAYPLDIVEKSRALLDACEVTRVTVPRLCHCHGDESERPEELFAFADGLFGRGPKLARCAKLDPPRDGSGGCAATFALYGDAIAGATLDYTTDFGDSRAREWKAVPAAVAGDTVSGRLPEGATGFFFSVRTGRGHRVSSDAVVAPDRSEELKTSVGRLPAASHAPSTRAHSGIPSVAASPKNGRLWCTWYGGPKPAEDHNNYAILATSADGGDSWKEVLVVDPDGPGPLRAFDPQVWIAPDGKLRWVWAVQSVRPDHLKEDVGTFSNAKDTRSEMCVLDAENEPAGPLPETRIVGRGVMMGKPAVMDSGTQLWPLARWGEERSSSLYASKDGLTFEYRGGATYPPGVLSYDEHQVVALGGRELLTMARLGSWDRPVGIGEARSHDGGRTWTDVKVGRLPHCSSRFFLSKLRSGSLLLVKHGPLGGPESMRPNRDNLTAYVSRDNGQSWEGGLLLDAREWVSYPDGQQLEDGRIVVVYDYERTKKLDILFAEFTEEDALAGRDVSGKVRLRRRISGRSPAGAEQAAPPRRNGAGHAENVWVKGAADEMNAFYGFFARFNVRAGEKPVLRLGACSAARVYVNGRFAAYGPARSPDGFCRRDEWPLGDFVRAGENTVAIEVQNDRVNQYYLPDRPAWLFAEVVSDDGRVLAATGSDFKAVRLPRVKKVNRFSYQRGFADAYAVTPESYAWRTNGLPRSCLELERRPDLKVLPRGAARPDFRLDGTFRPTLRTFLREEPDRPLRGIIAIDKAGEPPYKGFRPGELEWNLARDVNAHVVSRTAPAEPGLPLALDANEGVAFKSAAVTAGFPMLSLRCTKPATVYLVFDEVAGTNGVPGAFRFWGCTSAAAWKLGKSGDYELECFNPYGLGAAHVFVTDGSVELRGMDVRTYQNPEPFRARFACSDPRLEKVFAAAQRSLAHNSVDAFTDCPGRERGVWLGDTVFTGRAGAVLTGELWPERSMLENYALGPRRTPGVPDGILPMLYPGDSVLTEPSWIPNFSMWAIVQLADYVERSGDRTVLPAWRPRAEAMLDYFRSLRNGDGLLENLPGWVFVEWSKAGDFTKGVSYPSNMTYAYFLDAVARLFGRPDCAVEAGRVRAKIREQAYDGKWFHDQALRSPDGKLEVQPHVTEACQYFAFFSRTADARRDAGLWKTLVEELGPMRKEGVHPTVWPANQLFGMSIRFVLLTEAGLARRALQEQAHYLGPMAETTGTLWEGVGKMSETGSFSLDHGFPSLAAWVLVRNALGVTRLDRATKTVAVEPKDDLPLEWCSAELPVSATETLGVSWKRVDGKPVVTLDLPEGWRSSAPQEEPAVTRLWEGGEGIRFCDFSSAAPAGGLTDRGPSRDKWELVGYDTTLGPGTMLFSRRDAVPGPVTVDPKLTGWYRIYVATFSGENGRLWLRMTGDPSPSMFVQGKTGLGWSPCEQGEEVYWKSADLTGRAITVGKPDGRKSAEKCVGLMWLRFVPMTDAEVAAAKAEFASEKTRNLHAHCDMDWIHFYGPDVTLDEYCSLIDAYRDSDVSMASVEVCSTLSDKAWVRKALAGPDAGTVDYRWPSQLNFDDRREEVCRAWVARAEQYGIRLLAAHRMGLSNFVVPADDICFSGNSFVTEHPQWLCRDRDGETVGFLSYAYPEVGDFMVEQFLKHARLGFHGATLILHRGIEILFEEPVLQAFRRRHPGVDPRTLSLDDPRLAAVRCEFFTDFIRRLRAAFDRLSSEQGRPRLLVNPIVCVSRADNLRLGLDVETWMREKLVDSVVVGMMSLWEDEDSFRDEANPGLLSVEKYAACKNRAERGPVRREFDSRLEWRLPGVPWYVNLAKETGIPVYFDIQWEGQVPPEGIPAYAQAYYELGAENLNLWDCFEYRVSHRPEWFVTSRLGHRSALKSLPTQKDAYRRRFRILMLNGLRFSGYHPSWRG